MLKSGFVPKKQQFDIKFMILQLLVAQSAVKNGKLPVLDDSSLPIFNNDKLASVYGELPASGNGKLLVFYNGKPPVFDDTKTFFDSSNMSRFLRICRLPSKSDDLGIMLGFLGIYVVRIPLWLTGNKSNLYGLQFFIWELC